MPEHHLSPAFEALTHLCPSCGNELPCPLHDEALREALLAPPPPEYPWNKIERTDLGNYGDTISSLLSLPDGSFLVGGWGGRILRVDPSKPDKQRETDLGNYGNDIWSLSRAERGFLVGGVGGILAQYAIPLDALRRYHESIIAPPEVPPMPEA